jgi:Protein of unknown function (DUF433).
LLTSTVRVAVSLDLAPVEELPVQRSVVAFEGCYPAARAAALSGVPKSTVYDWARKELVVPSVSQEREMLWSYADLIALRVVQWLRHPKQSAGADLGASPMSEVRRALDRLDSAGLDIWDPGVSHGSPLYVDARGRIYIAVIDGLTDSHGRSLLDVGLDVLGSFAVDAGHGPNLIQPRSHLRIVPGKCAGEPHVSGTRVTTLVIKALADRGFDEEAIARLYPDQERVALLEAIDLERTLAGEAIAA